MSRTSKTTTPFDIVRWFVFGLREHRLIGAESRSHDWRLMDAYWAGHRFGFKLPWFIRKGFPRGQASQGADT